MDGHLGSGVGEVYEAAQDVLRFWFEETPPERRFAVDPALDAEIRERFGAMRDDVLANDALGWRGEPDTMLAAIILLDQFSRNLYREDPRAYEADPLAESLTREAIDRGWVREVSPERAVFLLMPLMHAEHADAQALSVASFEALGIAENIDFARKHADVIARFGRFPSRNAALGRASTPDEVEFLKSGPGW